MHSNLFIREAVPLEAEVDQALGTLKVFTAPQFKSTESENLALITSIVTETVAVSALFCFGQQHYNRVVVHSLISGTAVDLERSHYYLFLIVKDF
jgi:hypothetical protein